jgi:hypothetical protein
MSRIVNDTGQLMGKKMKRKKYYKNKLTQKDYNPFDEMWFWLHLASIPIKCQNKHDLKQSHCIDKQNSNSNIS